MIAPLLGRNLKGSLPATLCLFAVIAMYVVCIVYMFDPETAKMLDELMTAMPQLYDAFGMGHDTSTLTGFMLNYLYGFLLTLLPLVLTMLLVHRQLVRPIARGELAWVLASPNGRGKIISTVAAGVIGLLAVTMLATFACEVAAALALYPDDLDVAALLRVNAGAFCLWLLFAGICLWLLFAGICLLSAVVFAGTGLALWAGGAVCLVEFLVQMVAQVGDGLADLGNATFFTLFDPYGLAASSGEAALHAGLLGVCGVALIVVAALVFRRRDLVL